MSAKTDAPGKSWLPFVAGLNVTPTTINIDINILSQSKTSIRGNININDLPLGVTLALPIGISPGSYAGTLFNSPRITAHHRFTSQNTGAYVCRNS